MTLQKIIHKDGSESIVVTIGSAAMRVTLAEWSKLISSPQVVAE